MQGDRALWCYSVQRSYASEREASIGHGCVPALICFSSNLHVTGFSSCRITIMIQFLSSVISMVAPTWCHGAIWGNPFQGEWWSTVLTSEFTHFNLVIRLSKAKQLALPFSSLLGLSRWSVGPRVPRRNACLSEWSRSEQSEISFFRCSFSEWSDMCITTRHRDQAGTWP